MRARSRNQPLLPLFITLSTQPQPINIADGSDGTDSRSDQPCVPVLPARRAAQDQHNGRAGRAKAGGNRRWNGCRQKEEGEEITKKDTDGFTVETTDIVCSQSSGRVQKSSAAHSRALGVSLRTSSTAYVASGKNSFNFWCQTEACDRLIAICQRQQSTFEQKPPPRERSADKMPSHSFWSSIKISFRVC